MLETRATVVKVEKNQVWLKSSQPQSCGHCAQQQQCATRVLDNFSQKQTFAISSELELKSGDAVQIIVAENGLLRAAIILYLWPLFALFAGAACAESLLPANFTSAELVVSCSAGLSFLLSLRLIKPLQQRFLNSQHCQPMITEKL